MANVSNIVKSIQDIMRKDAGTYGDAQRLEQLGWMFFLKIFDDREQELQLVRDSYRSSIRSTVLTSMPPMIVTCSAISMRGCSRICSQLATQASSTHRVRSHSSL